MAAGTSFPRCLGSGAQRAPSARAAPQRPAGAVSPAPIRADPAVLAAKPTDPGKSCSADAPCPPAALLAGSLASAHAKCRHRRPRAVLPPQLHGRRSASQPELCARTHLPLGSERPATDPGLDGAVAPALLGGPRAPLCPSAASRARARSSGLCSAPQRSESPADLAAEQSAARRWPPGGPAPAGPRGPAPGRSPSHTPWAPRPAASCRPTLDALQQRPATPPACCSLAAADQGDQPGEPLERSP